MSTVAKSYLLLSTILMAAGTPVIRGRPISTDQQKGRRLSTADASPYVFYTAVTDCDEKQADITYEAGSNESRQETDDLPWLDSREFHSGASYYISAQKKSDDDGCELRVTIFLVHLTPEQVEELPNDPNKAITFIILKGGARTMRTGTTTLAYGVAEADWAGDDNEQDCYLKPFSREVRSKPNPATEAFKLLRAAQSL